MAEARMGLEGRVLPLWFGILGPPVFWAMRLGISYVLVPYACRGTWVSGLHAITAAALLAAAFAGLVAWKQWTQAGRGTEVNRGAPATRSRFMALTGILGSIFFVAVIVAEGLANVMVDPCQTAGSRVE